MKVAVSNSSPLILLGKIKRLEILTHFYDLIYIPTAVFEETVNKGINHGFSDAYLVQGLIDEDFIKMKDPPKKKFILDLKLIKNLHSGEIDAIRLSLSLSLSLNKNKENNIILDDDGARSLARYFGLNVKGTLGLLIDYRKNQNISADEAKNILYELNSLMYLSSDLYEYVYKKLI